MSDKNKPAFDIAVFNNIYDRAPKAHRCTHDALEKALTTFDIVGDSPKDRIKCWSPTRYKWVDTPESTVEYVKSGVTDKGKPRWRSQEKPIERRGYYLNRGRFGVLSVSCFVLDYDDGTPLEEARAPWMRYNHCWHSSYSHTNEVPKFRLIVFLADPVDKALWPRVWRWGFERAAGSPDEACKDPSRIYLVPTLKTENQTRLCGSHETGEFLTVDWDSLPDERGNKSVFIREVPRPEVKGPIGEVLREVRSRLKHDSVERQRVAVILGAEQNDDRAWGMRCPACGRASVWFLVHPGEMKGAECNHKNSCGWFGFLDQLLDGAYNG